VIALGLIMIAVAFPKEAKLDDYQPLQGYLELAHVEPVVQGALPPLAVCFEGLGEHASSLDVQLDIVGSGAVSHAMVVLEPADEQVLTCTRQALCSLTFERHDEQGQRWSFSVAHQGERAYLMPSLAFHPPRRLPLFLHLPPSDDPAVHDWLVSVIGPDVYPPAPPPALPPCATLVPPAPTLALPQQTQP